MGEHEAHRFTRLLSEADTGQALYGCAHAGCAATEVRRKGAPSPFAERRAAATRAAQSRRRARGAGA